MININCIELVYFYLGRREGLDFKDFLVISFSDRVMWVYVKEYLQEQNLKSSWGKYWSLTSEIGRVAQNQEAANGWQQKYFELPFL